MDAALPNSVCCPEGLRLQFFLWVLRVCVCVSVCVCVCVFGVLWLQVLLGFGVQAKRLVYVSSSNQASRHFSFVRFPLKCPNVCYSYTCTCTSKLRTPKGLRQLHNRLRASEAATPPVPTVHICTVSTRERFLAALRCERA